MNSIGLCRAKTLDFNWKIGFIVSFNNKHYLIPEDEVPSCCNNVSFINIIEDTICRFTGKVDYEGERIFENDIFAVPDEDECGMEYRYRVAYDEEDMMWIADDIFGGDYISLGEFRTTDFDIRGNCFDNPELYAKGCDEYE